MVEKVSKVEDAAKEVAAAEEVQNLKANTECKEVVSECRVLSHKIGSGVISFIMACKKTRNQGYINSEYKRKNVLKLLGRSNQYELF